MQSTTEILADRNSIDQCGKLARLRILAGLLAVTLGLCTWSVLYANNLSLSVWYGLHPSSKSEFLDGTNHVFQKGSYHLGNALRTWGETYGVKLGRAYVVLGVTHVNPFVTEEEANE